MKPDRPPPLPASVAAKRAPVPGVTPSAPTVIEGVKKYLLPAVPTVRPATPPAETTAVAVARFATALRSLPSPVFEPSPVTRSRTSPLFTAWSGYLTWKPWSVSMSIVSAMTWAFCTIRLVFTVNVWKRLIRLSSVSTPSGMLTVTESISLWSMPAGRRASPQPTKRTVLPSTAYL